MNEGARMFAKLVAKYGATHLGSVAGCSRQMSAALATGERKPGDELRARLAEKLGIPAVSWDAEVAPPKAAKRRGPRPALSELGALVDRVDAAIEVAADPVVQARLRTLRDHVLRASRLWRDALARLEP